MKLPWVVLSLTAVAALSVSGCGISGLTYSTTLDDRTEHAAVTAVRISGRAGDVTVQPGGAGQVRIHRKIRYSGTEPSASTYRIDAGTLYLDTNCGRFCTVDYDVRVPDGVTVTGEAGAGDVQLTGVSTVDIGVNAGDVTLTRATGPVHIRANAGNIRATDIRAATTDLEAHAGDITLDLAAAGNVTATTTSGNISVQVPSGTGYRIDAGATSGDTTLRVPTDPNGAYRLSLHATSGDIQVSPR